MPVGCPLGRHARTQDLTAGPTPMMSAFAPKSTSMAQEFPGGDLLLGGSHRDTLWEKAYMLGGMETMMVNSSTEPEFVREVLHRIMDFQLGIAAHYLKLGIKVAFLGDDLGSQIGPLLSPRLVRQFLMPEYRRLCNLYKEHGVLIRFHSCGNIESVLDNSWNWGSYSEPGSRQRQRSRRRSRAHQGKITLHGGISSQLLMEASPEQITAEVRRLMWLLGQQGGYICAPDQDMPYSPAQRQALHRCR